MDATLVPEEVPTQAVLSDAAQRKTQLEADKLEREIQKLDKETEKVELELKDLRRRWWQRPQMVAAFLPTLLAAGTLVTAYKSGWFQAESVRLENNKHDLKEESKRLKQVNTDLAVRGENLQRRFNADSARIAVDRLAMQERLTIERNVNEYRINSARSKAGLLVAAVKEQAQLEKRRLEELARKVSFEALFKASERDFKAYHFPPKPGIVDNTVFIDKREPAAAAAASYVMVAILKKGDKRATELRAALAHKLESDSKLGEEVIGMYLYTLYKGTGEAAWRDQFLVKSQSVLAQMLKQSDDEFDHSDYFDLFKLPDWSREDREELGKFLTKNIRNLRAEPGKQATLLDLFVETVRIEGNTPQLNIANHYPLISQEGPPFKVIQAFYQKYPKDFTYLLQLSRDMLLTPSNFPTSDATEVDEDMLAGPMHWLATFAPIAMAAVTAHILVKYPFLPYQRELHKVHMRGEKSVNERDTVVEDTIKGGNWSLAYKLYENTTEGLYSLRTPESDYPPDVIAGADKWRSWSAKHPRLQFWLTSDLSFLANDHNQLYERLQWRETIFRPNAPDPMSLKPRN